MEQLGRQKVDPTPALEIQVGSGSGRQDAGCQIVIMPDYFTPIQGWKTASIRRFETNSPVALPR